MPYHQKGANIIQRGPSQEAMMWVKLRYRCDTETCGRDYFTVKREWSDRREHEVCTGCMKLADRVRVIPIRMVPPEEEPLYA